MKIFFLLLFCSCAVGPDYKQPKLPEYNVQSSSDSSLFSSEDVPAEWWKLYSDPELEKIVQEAFVANLDLKGAAANLNRAESAILEYQGNRLPVTTATGSAVRSVAPSAGGASMQTMPYSYPTMYTYDYGLSMNLDMDVFGRLRRGVEAGKAEAGAMKAAYHVVKITVIANVIRAYMDACAFGRQLTVTKHLIEMLEEGLRLTERNVTAGRGTPLDLARQAALLSQTKANVPPLESNKKAALFRLATLLGKTPDQFPKAAASCETFPLMTSRLPVGDGSKLLLRRPDVWVAERRLAGATASIGIAKAGLYPTLSFGASAGYTAHEGHGLGSDKSERFSIGPLVSWSIPNIAVAKSRIKQAKANTKAALANYEGTVLNALRDVETNLTTYSFELDKNKELTVARDESLKAVNFAKRLFGAGAGSFLDVLDAQRSLANAELLLSISDSQVAYNRIALFLALGGGWK